MVRDKDVGAGLVKYFKNAVVETDGELPAGYDIIIILGTSE